MKIGTREIGPAFRPYIIAEIGVNHDGSLDRAIELIHAAKAAGADAVKTQWFRADLLLSRAARLASYQKDAGAEDPFEMLKALELDDAAMREIVDVAHALGMHAIATIFSVELVQPAAHLAWDALKTASPDLINLPLLAALGATSRPLLISTGASTAQEVERAALWLDRHTTAFFHCVSAYPTPEEEAALGGIRAVAKLTGRPTGYSDHTECIETGGLAVAAGASLLEKHLTYDRHASGPDHAASLDPSAFTEYTSLAHRAWRMLGPSNKELLAIERDVRSVARQSLTTTHAMSVGHRLQHEDLTIKRPGIGLEPWRLDEVIGRILAHDVQANQPLTESDLA